MSVGSLRPLISLKSKQTPQTVRLSARLSTMVPGPMTARVFRLCREASDHTNVQYSNIGLSKPLYAASWPLWLSTLNAFLRKRTRFTARRAVLLKCWPYAHEYTKHMHIYSHGWERHLKLEWNTFNPIPTEGCTFSPPSRYTSSTISRTP